MLNIKLMLRDVNLKDQKQEKHPAALRINLIYLPKVKGNIWGYNKKNMV